MKDNPLQFQIMPTIPPRSFIGCLPPSKEFLLAAVRLVSPIKEFSCHDWH